MAEVLLALLLETLLELGTFRSLTLGFLRGDILALVVVDVPSDFKVEICLSGCRCDAFSSGVWLAWSNSAVWSWLVRLQTTRSVCCNAEVAGEWWADI